MPIFQHNLWQFESRRHNRNRRNAGPRLCRAWVGGDECAGAGILHKGGDATPYPNWQGQRIIILASGPSLTEEDARAAQEKGLVIGVNNGIRFGGHGLYAGDLAWWNGYRDLWQPFTGPKWTISRDAAAKYDLIYVNHQRNHPRLDNKRISTGGNSGHQAVSLAYMLGAREIVLLGFDMQPNGQQHHFFGNHSGHMTNPSTTLYQRWIKNLHQLVKDIENAGVPVLNASRKTALELPRIDFDQL